LCFLAARRRLAGRFASRYDSTLCTSGVESHNNETHLRRGHVAASNHSDR